MTALAQDRLVRKETALGVIREFEPPQDHIGLRLLAPFQAVATDDVIFEYTRGFAAGLAPARAEDAESEMAGKDDSTATGRASVIDWAIKDHYDPSDVSRYREDLILSAQLGGSFPLSVGNIREGFDTRLALDLRKRRAMLDNRLEWLIMQAVETGGIAYDDGKIKFSVDFGRPANQELSVPPSTGNDLWDTANADPIEDLRILQQTAYDLYGVNLDRFIISKRIFRALRSSTKWASQGPWSGADPQYAMAGWNDERLASFIEDQLGITFLIYDSVYRTRTYGSNTMVNNRFTSSHLVIGLPSVSDVAALESDMLGFGKTLTSPHPEGNWTPGYYEWEKDTGPDPWGYDIGVGIKAFPVFPHMDKTYTMAVLAP